MHIYIRVNSIVAVNNKLCLFKWIAVPEDSPTLPTTSHVTDVQFANGFAD